MCYTVHFQSPHSVYQRFCLLNIKCVLTKMTLWTITWYPCVYFGIYLLWSLTHDLFSWNKGTFIVLSLIATRYHC